MEVGGFVEIGDCGNGGNVGDGMKILSHDVIVGRDEGHDLALSWCKEVPRLGSLSNHIVRR